MPQRTNRREFLTQAGAAGVALGLPTCLKAASLRPAGDRPRVALARDAALEKGAVDEHAVLLQKLLGAALVRVTREKSPAAAWRKLFSPTDRVGLKVNSLGLPTHPTVVTAVVSGLVEAGLPAEQILIWDRFDVELDRAGFELNRSGRGPRCYGTDAEHHGRGYEREVRVSGEIGSCYSRIVTEQVDALISLPVLKDHNLAGASLGMKNFYGAIHNPNKYHDHNCDPYVADVVAHPVISAKWRLTVCDATRAQFHGGPARSPGYTWPWGGLLVGTDFVATDAVAADLLDQHRQRRGLRSLAAENRPTRHIRSAAARRLGQADLAKIERIEI